MKSSPSPSEQEYSIKNSGYFNSLIPTSGRQRTTQACDKCRERKTKCSGEKPVCQRCTNRGLICEYSYREPRMRGPARARTTHSTTTLLARDSPSKPHPISIQPRQDIGYLRPPGPHRNHQPLEYSLGSNYSVNSAASGNHSSTSPYLGPEPTSYSGLRALHLSHWADVRRSSSRSCAGSNVGLMGFGSPQIPEILATAHEANSGVMVDNLHSTVRQSIKKQDTLLGCTPNSSSFSLEAQQSPRYSPGDLHYDYRARDYTTLEFPLSSSPNGSCNGYQSSSTVSSSTPTPPFYPLDHLGHSSIGIHGRLVANEHNSELLAKRDIYAEDDTTSLTPDFSYARDLGVREDWCIDSGSNKLFSMGDGIVHAGGKNDQSSVLWSTDFPQVSQVELDFRCQFVHRDSLN